MRKVLGQCFFKYDFVSKYVNGRKIFKYFQKFSSMSVFALLFLLVFVLFFMFFPLNFNEKKVDIQGILNILRVYI